MGHIAWLLTSAALVWSCSDGGHSPPAGGGGSAQTGGEGPATHTGGAGSGTSGSAAQAGEAQGGAGAQTQGGAPQGGVTGTESGGANDAGSAGSDANPGGAGSGGTSSTEPPSCRGAAKAPICGPNVDSCCLSLDVPGQTFYRSYDGVSTGYTDQSSPASVSTFRLDRFEVTVGRFRKFVSAAVKGFRPDAGSGKHTHLNSQQGLANAGPDGGNEPGWDDTWNAKLPVDADAWNSALSCDNQKSTWTPEAKSNENAPVNCVTWYEAYAFCIWDDGFLPSEAEWNDVATGGDQQRVYPWSLVPSDSTIDCLHANFAPEGEYCTAPPTGTVTLVGAESPKGDSRWGHADMGGNVYEWTLDNFVDPYVTPCADCAYLDSSTLRTMRGGSYSNDAPDVLASARGSNQADSRSTSLGVRCARPPAAP